MLTLKFPKKETPEKTGYPSIDRTHLEGIDPKKLNPTVLPLNLFGTFLMINSKSLDEVAIERGNKRYTKRQLKRDTIALAKAFLALGLKSGDTLAIMTPNLYEGIALTFAANALAIKVAYFDEDRSGDLDQLRLELIAHTVDALVVYDRTMDFAKTLFSLVPILRFIISITPEGEISPPKRFFASGQMFISYEEFTSSASRYRGQIQVEFMKHLMSRDELLFLQTSGSTSGKPKGLVFTNESIFAALIYAANSTGTKTHDAKVKRVLCIMPYRFPYGWMPVIVNVLGGNLVRLAEGGSLEDIAKYYTYEPSYVYGTPLIFRQFMKLTPEDADLSFLEAFFCSGLSISEVWYEAGIEYLREHNSHAELRNNYGIGEAMCVGTASDGVPHRPNTSGKFYLGPEWVIVDENLNEVKYGEVGEILVRSKSLFRRYFNDTEATLDAFVTFRGKRFYRTGDYASLSEDGYVTIAGREKRFIQPLGAIDKVNSETIEKALLGAVDDVEACATGISFADGVEAFHTFVVLKDGVPATKETSDRLFSYLEGKLLDYQIPNSITFLDALPVMDSGKTSLVRLDDMATAIADGMVSFPSFARPTR